MASIQLGPIALAQETPVNVGTYIAPDDEETFFKELVNHRAGNTSRAKSGADILNSLAANSTEGKCIKTWVHAQHGWLPNSPDGRLVDGGFGGGQRGEGTGFYRKDQDPQPRNGGRANGGRNLNDLKSAIDGGTIRFCRQCRIYIYGCEIASIGTFAAELSRITKCEVYAANGKSSTAHDNGGRGKSTDPWRAEGGWKKLVDGAAAADQPSGKYIEPTVNW